MAARVIWAVVLLLATGGCTSFKFASGGKDGAPDELVDEKDMVQLPAGKFLMGFSQGEPDEFPVHEIQVKALKVDRTEVTNGHYRACVEAGVCRKSPYADDKVLGRPRHPVVGVTWGDASKYCQWIERRLPTEAEWEYAARYPEFSVFPWEGRFRPMVANVEGAADGYDKTAPVASFADGKSGAGLMDMGGNVAEWCADWYDAVYYQQSPGENPAGPQLSTGKRVIRGGSWADVSYRVRTTARDAMEPQLQRDSVGFRCAKDAPGAG